MKRVYVAPDPMTAHFVVGLLDEVGIPARVFGEELYRLGYVPAFDALPEVHVLNDADTERAREVVAEFESGAHSDAPSGPPWDCPKCGETLDAQFAQCWKCGTERPA